MAEDTNHVIDMSVVFRADTTELDPAVEKLNQAQESVEKIQYADINMANLSNLTRSAVNSANYVANDFRGRAEKFSRGSTDYDTDRLERRLEHSYKEAGALLNLYGGNDTSFSLSRQKSFIDSLDDEMKHLLDSTTVELANLIKTVTSENFKGIGQVRERNLNLFAQALENSNPNEASRIFEKVRGAKGYTGNIEKQYIELVAARALPPSFFNEYSRERFGHNIVNESLGFEAGDVLPKRYLGSWRENSRTYKAEKSNNDSMRYLRKNYLDILDEELSQDPLLVQSAIDAGIATRKKNGQLERAENISAEQIKRLQEASYQNLIASAMGFMKEEDFFDINQRERAVRRISSGNSGRLLGSMSRLESFDDEAYFTPTSNLDTDTTVAIREPKRVKKMYGSVKIDLAEGTEKQNAINESQITRLLGYDSRPNRSDVSDEMVTLMLGSDYEAVKDQIENIRKNGYTRNGINYRFHAAHRGDEGVELRMLSEAAIERTNKKYAPIAERIGLAGRNILDLFEDPNTFRDYAINGKHNDAVNKLYTDSYLVAPGKNFDGKVAIVDTTSYDENGVKQTLADGIMFAAKGLVSSSGQIRTALAGKGTLRSVGGEDDATLRKYLIDSGLATYEGEKPENWSYDDKNWHYYRRGIGGQMIDAIDAGYIIDSSLIKNRGIFKGDDGKTVSSEEANRRYEQLMNETGIGYVQDFDKEDRSSDNLGIQAMAYMKIPQEVKDLQMQGYEKRLEELQTTTGVLKYVFSNDMSNPYAKLLDKSPELINHPTIQGMIEAYTERLFHDVSSGALVDFGLDENSKFMNERLTQDLTYQHYREKGISDEQMKKAREALRSGMAERYGKASDETLDEVIKDTMLLRKGNIIDFDFEDFDDVSVNRSPNGFGTVVSAKNRAKERLALEKVFGRVTDKSGIQIGAEDALTLSTADYDADTAKVATGIYAQMMKNTSEYAQELISGIDFNNIKSIALSGLAGSKEEADMEFIERLFKEPLGMGKGDAAGRRAVLFELSKPENRKRLRGALKGQDVYDFFSTLGKKPGNIEEDSDVNSLLGIGREYSKFTDNVVDAVNQDLIRNKIEEIEENGSSKTLNLFKSNSTGLQVDLDALKNLKLNNTNLPSIFNDAQRMAVEAVGKLNLYGKDNSKMIAISEAIEHLTSEDPNMENAGDWTKRLVGMKNTLLAQFSGGRTLVTGEEEKAMRTVLSNAEQEIKKYANEHEELWYDENQKSDKNKNGFIGISGAESRLRKQFGLHTIENFLDRFGMTESRARAVYGEDYAEQMLATMRNGGFSLGDDIDELANPKFVPAQPAPQVASAQKAVIEQKKEEQKQLEETKREIENVTAESASAIIPSDKAKADASEIIELTKQNALLNNSIATMAADDEGINASIIENLKKKKEENEKRINEIEAAKTHSEEEAKANVSQAEGPKIDAGAIVEDRKPNYRKMAAVREASRIGTLRQNETLNEESRSTLDNALTVFKKKIADKKPVDIDQLSASVDSLTSDVEAVEKYENVIKKYKKKNAQAPIEELLSALIKDEGTMEIASGVLEKLEGDDKKRDFLNTLYNTKKSAIQSDANSILAITQADFVPPSPVKTPPPAPQDTNPPPPSPPVNPPSPPTNPPNGSNPQINGNAANAMISAMAVKDYLEEGRGLLSEFYRTIYKDKDQSYSKSFLASGMARSRNFFTKQEELMKNNDLSSDQKAEMNEASTKVMETWFTASSLFAKNRSNQLHDNLFEAQSRAGDVYKFSDNYANIEKQYKEFEDLNKSYSAIVDELDTYGINTDGYRSVIEIVKSRQKESEKLFERAKQLATDQFNEFFDSKIEAAQKIVDEQNEEASFKDLNLTDKTPYSRMYRSVLNQRKSLQNNVDSIQKKYDDKNNLLESYKFDYGVLSLEAQRKRDNNIAVSEEDLAKMNHLEVAISKTTTEVNILKQALENAKKELSGFDSVDSIQTLNDTISNTADSLRMMATGTGRSSTLDKILSIGSNISDARAVNERMYSESEDKAAAEAGYLSRKEEIASWTKYYDDVIRLDDESMEMFNQQYARGMVSTPADNINQFFNSKAYTGERKIAELKEHLTQYEKALDEATSRAQRNIIQNRIDRINEEINTVTDTMNGFENSRAGEVAYANRMAMGAVGINNLSNIYSNSQYRRNRELEDYRRDHRFNGSFFTRTYESVLGQQNKYQSAIERDSLQIQNLKRIRAQEQHALDQRKDDKGFATLQTAKIGAIDSQIANLTKRMRENQQVLSQYSGPGAIASEAFGMLSSKIGMVLKRFGTRLFRQALNEAKQFVQQFDKAMTEIQMVTLKTDEQMSKLGSTLIDTAIKYNASVQEIAATTTSLYRQGLSDEDVEDRLGVLTKFSKTSNVSTADASKLLTVIMNSNMASDAGHALDVISAISDSAPTDANQISKTLQRSLYAASTNNVGLNQLIAMAAAMTSKTQLGGATAGTTISNVINRLTKVGSGDIVYDERGNAVGKTQLSSVLAQAGIDLYEDNGTVDIFKTLTELGKWWSKNDNATIKSAITNAVAGTGRQSNNFQAMMDAFSEVDESGKTFIETLLNIAESADGIVDKKFDEYTKSIAANLAELKSSFDKLVATMVDAGLISDAIGFFAEALQGLAYVNEVTNNAIPTLLGLGAAILAITTPVGQVIAGITAFISIFGALGNAIKNGTEEARLAKEQDRIDSGRKALGQLRKLEEKDSLSNDDRTEQSKLIGELANLGFITSDASKNIGDMSDKAGIVAAALDQAAKNITKSADELAIDKFKKSLNDIPKQDKEDREKAGLQGVTEEQIRTAMAYEQFKATGIGQIDDIDEAEYIYKFVYEAVKNDAMLRKTGALRAQGFSNNYREAAYLQQISRVLGSTINENGYVVPYSGDLPENVEDRPINDLYRGFIGTHEVAPIQDIVRNQIENLIQSLSIDWDSIIPEEYKDNKDRYKKELSKAIASQTIDKYEAADYDGYIVDWVNDYLFNAYGDFQNSIITDAMSDKNIQSSIRTKFTTPDDAEQEAYNTAVSNYTLKNEEYKNEQLEPSYRRVLAILKNSSYSDKQRKLMLSNEGILNKLSEDKTFIEFTTPYLNTENPYGGYNDLVDYVKTKSGLSDAYFNAKETADKRRNVLTNLKEGKNIALTEDLAQERYKDIASVIGEDVAANIQAMNQASVDFAYSQISAKEHNTDVKLSNSKLAEYGKEVFGKLQNGESIDEAFSGYSIALRNYMESNIDGLTELVSGIENGINTDVSSKKVKATLDKLEYSKENLSAETIAYIEQLTDPIESNRNNARVKLQSDYNKNETLGYYIESFNNAYWSNAMLESFASALDTDVSNINLMRNTDQQDLYNKLLEVYNKRASDIADASIETGTYLQTYDLSDMRRNEFETSENMKNLYDSFYKDISSRNMSAEELQQYMLSDKRFLDMNNDDVDRFMFGEASESNKQAAIEAIMQAGKHATEYFTNLEIQFKMLDEAIAAIENGTFNSDDYSISLSAEVISGWNSFTDSQKNWYKQYLKAGITGGKKYDSKETAKIAADIMTRVRNNQYSIEDYEKLGPEMQEALNEVAGGHLTEFIGSLSSLDPESDEYKTMAQNIDEAIGQILLSSFQYTAENALQHIASVMTFKNNPSAYFNDIANITTETENYRTLQRNLQNYAGGDRSDETLSALESSIGASRAQLYNDPATVLRMGSAKIDDYLRDWESVLKYFTGLENFDGMDIDSVKELARDSLSGSVGDAAAAMIESAAISITDGKVTFDFDSSPIFDSIQNLINTAADNLIKQSNMVNFGKANDLFNQAKGDYKKYNELLDKEDPNVRTRLMNDSNYLLMSQLYERGSITQKDYSDYLSGMAFGTYGDNPASSTPVLGYLFGSGVEARNDWNYDAAFNTLNELYNTADPEMVEINRALVEQILNLIQTLPGGSDVAKMFRANLQGIAPEVSRADGAVKTVAESIGSDYVSSLERGNRYSKEVVSVMEAIEKGGSDAANALNEAYKSGNSLNDDTYSLSLWKSGDRKNSNMLGYISSVTGYSQEDLKNMASGSEKAIEVEQQVDIVLKARQVEFEESQESRLDALIDAGLQDIVNTGDIELLKSVFVNGQFDMSGFLSVLKQIESSYYNGINYLSGTLKDQNFDVNFNVNATYTGALMSGDIASIAKALASGTSLVSSDVSANKTSFGKSYSGGRGSGRSSGGSSGKSEIDKLLEKLKHGLSLYEHQLKMYQYEESKYQNLDELTNYGHVLESEIELEKSFLPVLQQNIKTLHEQMETVSEGSEDWYKLRDALLEAEEKYEDINNTILENNKKLKENQIAIHKTRTTLEEMVVAEIEKRIRAQREMLSGSVSMQDIILDAIKTRYQNEWELQRKDIENKKKALQEEKSLIDERLNKRKQAEDEAAKYEQLSELKRQYALISMDGSRTKEAANLRKQISDLEKELGWDLAEQEAKAMSDAIQNQIDAYDEFATTGDEDLDKLLQDANNFGVEVKNILGMSHDDLMSWLASNDESYRNSLSDAQQQIMNSWDDTWKQMLGIVDTYWQQVEEILSSETSFLNFMKESTDYVNASLDQQSVSMLEWMKAYEEYTKAFLDTIDGYMHSDPGAGSWDAREYTGQSSSGGSSGGGGGSGGSGSVPAASNTNSVVDKQKQSSLTRMIQDVLGARGTLVSKDGKLFNNADGSITDGDEIDAITGADYSSGSSSKLPAAIVSKNGKGASKNVSSTLTSTGSVASAISAVKQSVGSLSSAKAAIAQNEDIRKLIPFDSGGQTIGEGVALLHDKERVLTAKQTLDFNKLVDIIDGFDMNDLSDLVDTMDSWSTYSGFDSILPHIDLSDLGNETNTVGDIYITLNEAKLESDADYAEVADRVGQLFKKELNKRGFTSMNY